MRCVVTGGAGFIGSHLVDQLMEDGHEVVVIDNLSTGRKENIASIQNNLLFRDYDLVTCESLEEILRDVDWVFHLAALADIVPSIESPDAYFEANVVGTFRILEASRRANIKRFIYAASSSAYGIPDVYPTPEEAQIDPQYPYALTKWMGEELVFHWVKTYGFPALSLRLFNVFGPRSRTSGTYGAVFGVFLAQKLAGQALTVVGDGKQTRDFTYVSDVVRALLTAASSNVTGRSYNVASGKPVSVNRLVELLGGKKIHIPRRPGEPECTHADITRIKTELGWEPEILFEEGVQRLVENIDDWRDAPVWTPEAIADATRSWFQYLGSETKS